jgi:hypothetical protein
MNKNRKMYFFIIMFCEKNCKELKMDSLVWTEICIFYFGI